jgi:hypothetical protein
MTIQIEKIKKTSDIFELKKTFWDKIYWPIWRAWYNFYWSICYTLNPRHKSIRKAVPKEWRDLDGIVEDVLSAVIISFVEEENGLDQIQMIIDSMHKDDEYLIKEWGSVDNFWNYYESRYKDYIRLSSIYSWVKSGRKAMQNYLDSIEGTNNWQEYGKVEQDIYDRDSEYLAHLVRLRKYLWT